MKKTTVTLPFILIALMFISSCSSNNHPGSDNGVTSEGQRGEIINVQTDKEKSSNSPENNAVIKSEDEQLSKKIA
jgi:hypothetical protein